MKTQILKLSFVLMLTIPLLIPQDVYSQIKPMRFGARIGWNYSFTNVEIGGLNVAGRNGINAGGVFEYWVSDLFAIHTDVLYNMKGNKWDRELLVGTAEYTWAFDYLSIPVLAKFAFGGQVKFYLVVGPEFSFLLSGNEVKEGEGWPATGERDLKEYMNSFEFAGDFGFGVDFNIEPVVLFIEIRGSLGITDVFKETPSGILMEEGTVMQLVPSLSIGILY